MSGFSHLARARAMRRLLANGAFWGAYGQLVVATGPIFTGLALWMGLEAADIALIASIVALAGLVQPLSSFLTGRLANPKRFIVRAGIVEITLTAGVVAIPLLVPAAPARFVFAAFAILAGTFTGNIVAPLFNSWFSTVLPEEARARFWGRRLVLVNLAAMAVGYASGQFIDVTGSRYLSFLVPYVVAWLVGAAGFWVLIKIPFMPIDRGESRLSFGRSLTLPFKHRPFRSLLLMYLTWVFGALMADPFYNVFMIQDLGVTYATIGLLNAVVLGVGILGYWLWGAVAGKFGSRPVLQLLIIPRLLLPLVWFFLTPTNQWLLFVIMVLNGIVFSGLTVSINTLLFGSVPAAADRAGFFGIWAFGTSLVSAAATAIGGAIVRATAESGVLLFGTTVSGIRITFLLSTLVMIVPVFLLRRVHDSDAKPVRHIVGQVLRGNPIGFVYNAFVFARIRDSESRAKAVRAMGLSRNPMAVERLVRALDDVDPQVREQATRSLGETRSDAAVTHLTAVLNDEESDVRAEAAQSLGKLRHPSGIDPLFTALHSSDSRVAISAARALADIGGAAVIEHLWQTLAAQPPKMLLPSLVDGLSRLGDLRTVDAALDALDTYTSPVVRLQLMNAICRTLGARNQFYELLSNDGYELAERLDHLLAAIARRLRRARASQGSPAIGPAQGPPAGDSATGSAPASTAAPGSSAAPGDGVVDPSAAPASSAPPAPAATAANAAAADSTDQPAAGPTPARSLHAAIESSVDAALAHLAALRQALEDGRYADFPRLAADVAAAVLCDDPAGESFSPSAGQPRADAPPGGEPCAERMAAAEGTSAAAAGPTGPDATTAVGPTAADATAADATGADASGAGAVATAARECLRRFALRDKRLLATDRPEIFAVVCLNMAVGTDCRGRPKPVP